MAYNDTYFWKGKDESQFVIVQQLWEEHKGEWRGHPEDWLQTCEMLREYIRKIMRAEHEMYLAGRCTRGRVAETQGQAILLGKIIAANKREKCGECGGVHPRTLWEGK